MAAIVAAVTRRFLFRSGALVVALIASSSCATFDRNNDAARVGGQALSIEQISALVGTTDDVVDAAVVRAQLTKWIRVELLEQATGTTDAAVATTANLDARLADAITSLASQTPDAGRVLYESGPAVSGLVCLAAITVDSPEAAEVALADLAAGMSFADAAATHSNDPGLAASGGVVPNQSGDECFPVAELNPVITDPVTAAGVGNPVVVDIGVAAVVMLRPFAELSAETQMELASQELNTTRLPELLAEVRVVVDPRYGVWNSATAEVDPLVA